MREAVLAAAQRLTDDGQVTFSNRDLHSALDGAAADVTFESVQYATTELRRRDGILVRVAWGRYRLRA